MGRRSQGRRAKGARPPSMPHDTRPKVDPDTLCRSPSARRRAAVVPLAARVRALRRAIARASVDRFRVIHFSIQQDHGHFIVEGDEACRARGGMHGLAIRLALAVNRALGRKGQVVGDRFHARLLTTPRQMRISMVYVLLELPQAPPGACVRGPAQLGAALFGGGGARPRSPTRLRRRRCLPRGWPGLAGDARAVRCGSRSTPPRRRDRAQLESADVRVWASRCVNPRVRARRHRQSHPRTYSGGRRACIRVGRVPKV